MEEKIVCKGCHAKMSPTQQSYMYKNRVVCPSCYNRLVENVALRKAIKSKSKNVAVVLAAFLGFWSWLYVFEQENRWKFWLNLCLTVVTLGIWGLGAWIWAIIDMSRKPISYFENYGKPNL